MESLILFIIIALVSSFFSSSKRRHDQSTPPIQKEHRQRPKIEIKTLDEFANEVMKQLTEEKEVKQRESVMVDEKEQEPSPIQQQVQPVPNNVELKERLNQTPVVTKETKSHSRKGHKFPFLSSKEALRNAIITQEILGPPKSKKR